jgi:hypothetical protein
VLTVPPVDSIVGGLTAALGIDASKHSFNATTIQGQSVGSFGFGSVSGTPGSMQFLILNGVTHFYPNGTNGSPIVMTDILWPFFQSAAW